MHCNVLSLNHQLFLIGFHPAGSILQVIKLHEGETTAYTCFSFHQPHVCRLRAFKRLHCFSNIVLCDGDGKSTQYDGLAFSFITDVMPVVMLAIVTIRMVAIFRSVAVPSFTLPLWTVIVPVVVISITPPIITRSFVI